MISDSTTIILVRPQMGANIGATARAMWNFGFGHLRLVDPRDGWPNIEAERNSAGALEKMPEVQIFDTLQEALSDQHYALATTARPREMQKDVFTPQEAARQSYQRSNKNIALVFGAERTGLTNDELALCHGIITIPTNPDFSSLNLAQSVLLMCWELSRHCAAIPTQSIGPSEQALQDDMGTLKDFDNFFSRLQSELEDADFFKSEGLKPTMLRNIRTLFLRAEPSEQELRTLHGILSALTKD